MVNSTFFIVFQRDKTVITSSPCLSFAAAWVGVCSAEVSQIALWTTRQWAFGRWQELILSRPSGLSALEPQPFRSWISVRVPPNSVPLHTPTAFPWRALPSARRWTRQGGWGFRYGAFHGNRETNAAALAITVFRNDISSLRLASLSAISLRYFRHLSAVVGLHGLYARWHSALTRCYFPFPTYSFSGSPHFQGWAALNTSTLIYSSQTV